MDHFYQLPMIGPPDHVHARVLHAARRRWPSDTTRSASARWSPATPTGTRRCWPRRSPTLDIVSGGRAQLGIGAGWFELEHDSLGFEFGTFTDRFEKLEEALQIIIPMLRGERPTLDGKHYQVVEAINQPPPVGRIPVMIGGGGEKKTLRMVAQYADESNLICAFEDIPRKLEVLADHCERLGRDRSEITVTYQTSVCIAPTHDQAEAELMAGLERTGLFPEGPALDAARARFIWGDPDEVAERLAGYLDAGLDGWTINMPANGYVPERVELLGETASKLLAARA